MDRPTLEVADIFRRYGDLYRDGAAVATAQRRVMTAIETCRTAVLGGHVEQCDACGHQRMAYNSCANRHCPKCQSLARAAWVAPRTTELLDCEYCHVVFTLPAAIAAIALQNKAVVYSLLFRATAETLRTIAADPRHHGVSDDTACGHASDRLSRSYGDAHRGPPASVHRLSPGAHDRHRATAARSPRLCDPRYLVSARASRRPTPLKLVDAESQG